MLEVIDGGLMTSVQDLGRHQYFSIALIKGGAMDAFSLRVGNLLVGNEPGEAGLEIFTGLRLRFLCNTIIAITGGDLSPAINGMNAPMWETIKIEKGDVVSFGAIRAGYRAYLAIAGGIDVPVVFGSKATYISGRRGTLGFGGFKGRLLKKGDILPFGKPRIPIFSFDFRRVITNMIPQFKGTYELRVTLGPFEHYLTEEGLRSFITHPWVVSYRAGRTGYWYDGPLLQFKEREEMQKKGAGAHPSNYISDGVPVGGVQAPFGVPVVFCVDQSTIGAHVKIATVISLDMDRVGQSKPGDRIFFRVVIVEETLEILKKAKDLLKEENLLN